MAGKNAKRKAKAEKAGIRSLEMSKEMWRMLADVSLMADALGAATPLAEQCRILAARAKYYLGEPENKHGLVRGELSSKEWAAWQELVENFADVSPPVKAFARALGELDTDQTITVQKMANPMDAGGQAQADALMVCRPKALRSLIEVLDFLLSYSKRDDLKPPLPAGAVMAMQALMGRTGLPVQKAKEEMVASVQSARGKLNALLADILKEDGRSTVPLMMDTKEAWWLSGLFRLFRETVHAGIKAPPEHAQGKKDMDHLLECAVRFFTRIVSGGEAMKGSG